jgi:hypothetical protein
MEANQVNTMLSLEDFVRILTFWGENQGVLGKQGSRADGVGFKWLQQEILRGLREN